MITGEHGSSASVSVIIPVFEQLDYLAEALESVAAQTRPPAEVIVVCDGGRVDPAPGFAHEVPVRVVTRPHGGPGAARTTGCALAAGEVLAFLDVDDLWMPEKLERQVAALERDPRLDMVFTGVEHFFCRELDRGRSPTTTATAERAGLLPSALAVRATSFARVGGFRAGVIFGEFLDWYARATDLGLVGCTIDETLVRRRVHPRNAGVEFRGARGDYVRVVKDLLDRRRLASLGVAQ